MTALAIALVHLYRHTIGVLIRGRCKYHPTCSQYAIDVFREFGFARGLVLASWRLLRCNPWSDGGVDYARDQTLFSRTGGFVAPLRRRGA